MTITRRQLGLGASAAAVTAVTGFPAIAQAPTILKFSHVVTNDTPKGKGALKFAELADKYTAGKVKVEVYANSTLYKDKEELEALQLGAVHLLAPSTAKFAPLGAKEFEALDLPFVFPNQATYDKVSTGPVAKYLFDKLEPLGVKGLAFWDNGFHMMSSNKPLRKPADFQGIKIRISGSKVAEAYFKKMGALPQILAFSEVYQALQTGVVDGCENTASNYFTQKFFEVQKHITIGEHAHLQYAVIAQLKFWNALAPDLRTALDKAMAEATVYGNSVADQDNKDALEAIRKAGTSEVYTLTADERKAFMEVMLPIHKQMETRVGKEVIALLHKEAGFTFSQ
jgi:C4-dicarboxylate-binding protein DctP